MSERKRSQRGMRTLVLLLFIAGLAALMIGVFPALTGSGTGAGPLRMNSTSKPLAVPGAGFSTSVQSTTSASNSPSLLLSVAANPGTICALELTSCPSGVGLSRVTLTAAAPQATFETWPAVQVAFVIETTVYDGVYDPQAFDPGHDQCALASGTSGPACEESNGVPFFVANAQEIANAIQSANPHSLVQFALVDYFATADIENDPDGSEYHVDIHKFVPASQFGQAVDGTFASTVLEAGYRYSDSDFSDNMLHSSSITALYGAIVGSALNWSADTHHVVVWMGSTAPRAPGYTQDYCVSPSDYFPVGTTGSLPCMSASCEPAYDYGDTVSPQCEGWTTSQDGNASHSIAALARTAPQCTDSIGGVCTIDTVDYWTTTTDPQSLGWPAGDATAALEGGPGGQMVVQNTQRVLLAGCNLAAATGGSWDGPTFFTCPSGQAGTLQPSFLGPYGSPNLQNPSLFAALRGVGFGPVTNRLVASGTSHPLFSFVPFGNIEVLPGAAAQFQTACLLGSGALSPQCPVQPQTANVALQPGVNTTVYSWNWSTVPSQNLMYAGDEWLASFWVMADGPPYGVVPVDACTTSYCAIGGSHALGGYFTAATYLPVTNVSVVVQSFPLGTLGVETAPTPPPPPALPPATPGLAPPPIATPAPLGLLSPIGVGAQVGIATVSLQAAAAGFVAAGFTAMTVRNRPMALAVAALSQKKAPVRSRFEEGATRDAAGIGRFE
jgi:hypothetical protein